MVIFAEACRASDAKPVATEVGLTHPDIDGMHFGRKQSTCLWQHSRLAQYTHAF